MGRKKQTRENSETQQLLMSATIEVVGSKGIEAASARTIATQAGVNQALIFYHFGTLTNLLISAIDNLNQCRFEEYEKALSKAQTIEEVLKVTFDIFEEDRHGPSYAVLSQMVAGAQNDPALAKALEPMFDRFIELIKSTLTRLLGEMNLPAGLTYEDIAIAVISMFLGVRLIGSVPKYDGNVDSLFAKIQDGAPLISMFITMLSTQK